jgi:hypothetical protein
VAKPHWRLPDGQHGCQHTNCNGPATWQWQRAMTPQEEDTYLNRQGPYGDLHHPPGPHTIAVFSCNTHAPQHNDGTGLNLDAMAKQHKADCPMPDPGCHCGNTPTDKTHS